MPLYRTIRCCYALPHVSLRGIPPRLAVVAGRLHARSLTSFGATKDAAQADSLAVEACVPHVPVLIDEILSFFSEKRLRVYVDGTLGAGGHATAMLKAHPELRYLVGFDLDPTAHEIASARLRDAGASVVPLMLGGRFMQETDLGHGPPSTSFELAYPDVMTIKGMASGNEMHDSRIPTAFLVHSNFSKMAPVLHRLPFLETGNETLNSQNRKRPPVDQSSCLYGRVDAMLLDLGMSSMQVDAAERGFSFLRDGPLDMRMDPGAALSAEDVVNTWSETELGTIIKDFGEERHWRGIARRIVAARTEEPIRTTAQLVRAVGGSRTGGGGGRAKNMSGNKDRGAKHPATRVFQALRIAVNGELASIASVIPAAVDALAPGGRLAVITFHSLEDRIVKWAFRQAAGMAPSDQALPSYCVPFDGDEVPRVKVLTRRPVPPSDAEQAANSRSRSAKLRVVEKLV